MVLIEALLGAGAKVSAHDPEALQQARRIFADRISYHQVDYDTLRGADALCIVTEWEEFRQPDFERMRGLMKRPIIFDGRNLYDPESMREFGFTYFAIGRRPVNVE